MCSNQFLWSIAASGDRLEVWQILGRSRAIYRHAQFDLTSGKRAERPSGGQFMHWNCLLIATTVKDIYRGHLNCFWHIMELSELNTEFLLTKKQKQKQLTRYNKIIILSRNSSDILYKCPWLQQPSFWSPSVQMTLGAVRRPTVLFMSSQCNLMPCWYNIMLLTTTKIPAYL